MKYFSRLVDTNCPCIGMRTEVAFDPLYVWNVWSGLSNMWATVQTEECDPRNISYPTFLSGR